MNTDINNLAQSLAHMAVLHLPHNVSDLILALAIRLAAVRLAVHTEGRHDDGFPEPSDGDDDLMDILQKCLKTAPDLPLAQQAAVVHHPDTDLAELCADGELELVRACNRGHIRILDSQMADCITAASAHGHVHVLDWLHRHSRRRMFYSHEAMDLASEAGEVHVLQWWLDSGLKLRYSTQAMDGASVNGETDVLEWYKRSGLPLKFTEDAIDLASADGHEASLQWWLESGLELVYSELAIHEATAAAHLDVLRWWKDSGLELKFDAHRIVQHCTNYGRADCLEWWTIESRLITREEAAKQVPAYDMVNCSLDEYWIGLKWRQAHNFIITGGMLGCLTELAAEIGRMDVLQWWLEVDDDVSKRCSAVLNAAAAVGQLEVIEWTVGRLNELGVKDWVSGCDTLVDAASSRGHVNVLEWWKCSGLDLTYTHLAIDDACANGHLDVIKWWSESGLLCRFTGRCVDKAAGGGHVEILRWLHNQPSTAPVHFPEDYTSNAMDSASTDGHVAPLQFFLDSGHPLKYTHHAMNSASRFGHTHVLDWWLRHKGTLDLKFSQAAIACSWTTVPILEWWHNSKLQISLDLDFGGLVPLSNSVTASIHWAKKNGYRLRALLSG
ncbi:hypothetical protein BCR44DRAFT_1463422 [Catenaria anguillulae PL171]|uniref:Ankyrin repeat-containing domain protein n=1 Tax=Catenaria anguillulae PL171 TaxID=765915 RepID=A0A1Y2HDJ7_9FUNG|nr:hypothetical protein BCR44DRAFT_1463422 [Catenaria anguillulae PL171]